MRRGRKGLIVTAVGAMLALGLTGGWVFGPGQPGQTADLQHAGFFEIADVAGVAPGVTISGGWNNTPDVYRTFIDVMPYENQPPPHLATTADEALPCKMEVTRDYRERYVNSLGNWAVRLHWQVKNVGSTTCSVKVYYGWVRNNA